MLHYYRLGQIVTKRVVAEFSEANMHKAKEQESTTNQHWERFSISGGAHNGHHTTDTLKQEKEEADGAEIRILVDWYEAPFCHRNIFVLCAT